MYAFDNAFVPIKRIIERDMVYGVHYSGEPAAYNGQLDSLTDTGSLMYTSSTSISAMPSLHLAAAYSQMPTWRRALRLGRWRLLAESD